MRDQVTALLVAVVLGFANGQCPLPSDEDVLANSGFEGYKHSVKPWTVLAYGNLANQPPYPGLRKPGYQSQSALGGGPGRGSVHNQFEFRQSYTVCADQPNILSFQYKYYDTSYPNRASVRGSVGDLVSIGPLKIGVQNNDTWKLYQQYFYGGTSLHIDSILSQTNSGYMFFDDVEVLPQDSLVVNETAPNIIRNGNFETGGSKPWNIVAPTGQGQTCAVSSPGDDSDYAFNCYFTTPAENNTFPISYLEQTFATTPQTRYLLSFDYKFAFPGQSSCQMTTSFTGGTLVSLTGFNFTSNDQSFHSFERGIIANGDRMLLSFQLTALYAKPCNISVDNISMQEVM